MTAEIAVMNKSAVALAADSKVTIGSARNKTYDTVNKLFTLSKTEPVGIMVYGNAAFMDIPWETVIKLYRSELADANFANVNGYSEDFIEYLPAFFPFEREAEIENATEIINTWLRHITSTFHHRLQHSDAVKSESDAKVVLENVINEYAAFFDEAELWKPRRRITRNRLESLYGDVAKEAVKDCFGSLITPKLTRVARAVALDALLSETFSDRRSGVVIAGFGIDEFFPTVTAFEVDGMLAGRLKCKKTVHSDLTRSNCGAILPFAQDDMVFRFMEGIDQEYDEYLTGLIRTVFHQGAEAIVDKHLNASKRAESKIQQDVKKEIDNLLADTMDNAEQYRRQKFVHSIMETLIILPKEELANLAESLVSLTSLQRRVTRDAESVGGPIDVAIISKGDGFVWIKRKYYFDAAKNPSFARNYFREIDGEGA